MKRALALLALALAACGAPPPGPGVECQADAGAHCTDAGTLRACEAGKWVEFGCPGSGACRTYSADVSVCDFTGVDAGACPSSVAAQIGWCTADEKTAYECVGGVFVSQVCDHGCEWSGTYPGLDVRYGRRCHVVP